MRLLLATAGSRGDVEPFIALGESAAAAGHRVRLVVPEALDVAAGVDIVSMGADFTRLIRSQGARRPGRCAASDQSCSR
ncbi:MULTISPECIES: glycosyltransferase [Microbacterium]|uniref:glycosyltransferase n=1 Tax=Microbacterium TaxID=33882 RepID=UPI00214B15F0|nr:MULTISPECIES: glycosyltransferase [unclassified Microbacterium]MCR2813105.1 glycosyltransferase [Microbacterium sp. zg.Y1084]MDL5487037.1 glycosyltransferase [Microbacterium sp. zg-Y1211]